MRKLIITSFIFLFAMVLSSQSQNDLSITPNHTSHSSRDVSISVSPNVLLNNPNGTQFAGGMKLRMFVGKRFSFDSELMLGNGYGHFSPGLIGLPLWYFGSNLSFSSDEEDSFAKFLIMGAMMILSAEHFAYHIPVENNTDISPYLSFLRFKQVSVTIDAEHPDGLESSTCFAIGLEINRYFKRFVLSPYIDYNIAYSGQNHGLNIGLYLGYSFPSMK
jgi:hypothetical protein